MVKGPQQQKSTVNYLTVDRGFNHLKIKTSLFIEKIVNNSLQVNEKGVLERMHITLQCWVVLGESLRLK
jgi:hypothetical protein